MERLEQRVVRLRRDILKAVEDIIGTYTLPNGQKVPAIAVDIGDNKFPPPNTQVQGLEVVIIPFIESPVSFLLGGIRWDYTSKLLLRAWSGDTLIATQRIVPLLGNQVRVGMRVLPNDKLGNIESRSIEFLWTHCTYGKSC